MGMDLMAMGMGMAMTVPENLSRYQHVYMAKLAEQTKRYKEMVKFMEMVVVCSRGELTGEERNLLSVASKKVVGSLRDAWQTVSLNEDNVVLVKNYISTVESELSAVCTRILKLLDTYLIPSASESESKVFYLKMKGDYHRYLAEFKIGTQKEEAAFDAILAYKAAQHIALADLAPTHPTRLGLALNLSVFFYQILDEPEKACSKAREAIDEAMDTLGDKSYKDDTAAVMQLLKDNLNLWGVN